MRPTLTLFKFLFKAMPALGTALFISLSALAGSNQNLIYQGRIVRPDGTLPNAGTIDFTVSIYSPSPSQCLLYQETHHVTMTGTQGMFSLTMGAGTRSDGGAHSFNQVFVNGSTLSGLTCASGSSYVAASTDDRVLNISFNDAGTTIALSPTKIKSVPFAMQAHEVDGWGLNNLVKVSSIGSPTTFTTAEMANAKALAGAACALNEILKWDGSAWACASDATGGAPVDASYLAKGIVQFNTDAATSGITVSSGVVTVNTGTTANKIVKLDGSAKLPAVDGSALTNLDPTHLSAAVAINKGGTGQITAILGFNALSPITTKGDLITSDGTNNVRLPAGTNGYVLTADSSQGSGIKWAPVTAGTVTSVSSANSDISVASGASTPVLTLNSGTGNNQIVKLDGSAKLPAVDGSALTNLNAGNISSGTLPIARGGTAATSFAANAVIVSNGTGSALQALNCTSGQVITFDVSGYAICGAAAGSNDFVNGGNSFAANATLGTNDAYSLGFKTNNSVAMTILSGGNVGIGTSSPVFPLDVSNKALFNFDQGTVLNNFVPVVNHSAGLTYAAAVTAYTQSGDTKGVFHAALTNVTPTNTDAYALIGIGRRDGYWTTTTTNAAVVNGAWLPGIGFSGYTSSNPNSAQIGAAINGVVDGTVSSGVLPSALVFRTSTTNNTGLTEAMRISSTGLVGIGVTSPSAKLDIASSLTSGNSVSVTSSDTGTSVLRGIASTISNSGTGSSAIYGNTTAGGYSIGVYGLASNSNVASYAVGVYGRSDSGSGNGVQGVAGYQWGGYVSHGGDFQASGPDAYGLYAKNNANSGNAIAFYTTSPNSASGYAVYSAAGKNYFAGNVGIGTSSPRSALDVSGTLATKPATSNATSTIDGSAGNIQYTTSSCGSFQFNNLKDGASYMFVVQGTTAATCTFTAYSDAGSTALTVHMPPDNGNTTASKHTVFNLTVVGAHVYVAWTPGY